MPRCRFRHGPVACGVPVTDGFKPDVQNVRRIQLGAKPALNKIFAVLFLLAGDRFEEQHRNAFGHPLGTGHSARFRNEKIGGVHPFADLPRKSDHLDIRVLKSGVGSQFRGELLVTAHAADDLDFLAPGSQFR
ncbi:hypothetical protein D3C74_246310 [compost metagenome]